MKKIIIITLLLDINNKNKHFIVSKTMKYYLFNFYYKILNKIIGYIRTLNLLSTYSILPYLMNR